MIVMKYLFLLKFIPQVKTTEKFKIGLLELIRSNCCQHFRNINSLFDLISNQDQQPYVNLAVNFICIITDLSENPEIC